MLNSIWSENITKFHEEEIIRFQSIHFQIDKNWINGFGRLNISKTVV